MADWLTTEAIIDNGVRRYKQFPPTMTRDKLEKHLITQIESLPSRLTLEQYYDQLYKRAHNTK